MMLTEVFLHDRALCHNDITAAVQGILQVRRYHDFLLVVRLRKTRKLSFILLLLLVDTPFFRYLLPIHTHHFSA
jgi:hypothetical protein